MRANQHVYTFKEKIIPKWPFKNRMMAEIVRKIKTQQNRNKAKEYKIQHKQ
jgi:predicted phosphatase